MDALDCIKTRRTIRVYADKAVEQELLGNVLEAGRLAPSAGNLQAWKFIVVTDDKKRKALAQACMQQFWMETAPVHVVICSDRDRNERMYEERGEIIYSVQNCAAAAENMLLAAHAQGLGACYVGAFEEAAIRRILEIPDNAAPEAVITLGYADETPDPIPKYYLDNITFIERWGNRIRDWDEWLGYHSHKIAPAIESVKKAAKSMKDRIHEKIKRG